MKYWVLALAALAAGCATAERDQSLAYHVVAGSVVADRGPDGNSVFLDSPDGLILVDTGRHPAHRDKLLAYARQRGLPIVALVNTHWHLDHTTGNGELRAAYPAAPLFATRAIEGALVGFIARSRASTQQYLDSGRATPQQRAEIERAFAAMDRPDALRPTRPVDDSGTYDVGGRRLRLNVAPLAVTEADLWIYDERARLAIVGDLVVDLVPFLDTACPEGWRRALDQIAATSFQQLIPGHGPVMDRESFLTWRSAFNNFIDCGLSDRARQSCIDGWLRDAATFIPAADRERVAGMAAYYVDQRLRAAPAERDRYCQAGT